MKFPDVDSTTKTAAKKPVVSLIFPQEQKPYLPMVKLALGDFFRDFDFRLNCTPEDNPQYTISCDERHLKETIGLRHGVTLNDYQGSIVGSTLFVNPFQNLASVPHAEFLLKRFVGKLLYPSKFYVAGQFTFSIVDSFSIEKEALDFLHSCGVTAWDIETAGKDLRINCCSIAGINFKTKQIKTYTIRLDEVWKVEFLKKLAGSKSVKVFQNGAFDNSYLLRYGICVENYLLDTLYLFHAWYAELPRTLGFISAFSLRDVQFWKDEGANAASSYEYLRYNARDAWTTLHITLSLLIEMPTWAIQNYFQTFPLLFPTLLMGLRGLKIDLEKLSEVTKEAEIKKELALNNLQEEIGIENFNPGSPKQVKALFKILGSGDLESTQAAYMEKFASRHPLNARIAKSITTYREKLKYISNYCDVFIFGKDRLLYSFNPAGTETGRMAGKASHFSINENYGLDKKPKYKNYGFQIQNVPVEAKVFIEADEDFLLFESDGCQAESRTTGYLSQCKELIDAVENSPDFHSMNASKFFGIPFEELYDAVNHKKLNEPIRDLGKRVNHGSNYNMGVDKLIVTMGEKNILEAKRLLKLPGYWTIKDCAQHFLNVFCAAYPRLKGIEYAKSSHTKGVQYLFKENTYYGDIIKEIQTTRMLVSPLGWTRYCFGDPIKSKRELNLYIAHPSQNLSVALVNRALMRIHNHPRLRDETVFRLNGQVHDSILYQIRKDKVDELLPIVESLLQETILVHGKKLTIPFETGKGKAHWK